NLLRSIIPTPARPLLPFICFKPTEERKNCVEISACGTDTGAFDCFRSEDCQREMKAILKIKDQHWMLAVGTFPSDDAEGGMHSRVTEQGKRKKNEHTPAHFETVF